MRALRIKLLMTAGWVNEERLSGLTVANWRYKHELPSEREDNLAGQSSERRASSTIIKPESRRICAHPCFLDLVAATAQLRNIDELVFFFTFVPGFLS
jgi:hypothetical protein